MPHKVTDEIQIANEWRLGEFAKMRMNSAGVDPAFWWRLCIPMVYAHWEGYVVSAIRILVGHLNELQLHPERVPVKLIVLGLGDSYRSLSGKQSMAQRIAFTEKFRKLLSTTIVFEKKINTKSNLRPDVLEELCTIYGFNFDAFSEYTADIHRLVGVRNAIAHGENSVVPTEENLNKYMDAVISASDVLRNEIDGFLNRGDYAIQEPHAA